MADQPKIIISAVDNTRAAFGSVKTGLGQIEGVGNTLNNVIGRLAPLLGAATLTGLISDATTAADKINDIAKANEVAVGSVIKLSESMTLNGGNADDTSKLFASLTNKLDEAAAGSEKAQKQFAKVGVSLQDLRTLDGQQLFEKSLAGLSQLEDPVTRNAAAMDLFGKAVKGVDIKGLADDYSSNQKNFDETERAFNEIGKAMDNVDKAQQALKLSVATNIAPWYASTLNYISELITGYDKLEKNMSKVRNGNAPAFKASPLITDKPEFGAFNLPKEFQGGERREVVVEEKKLKSTVKKESGKSDAQKYAEDVASLMQAFQQLESPAQSVSDKLQDQLDTYTTLDPAVQTYLQGLIDQKKASDLLIESQVQDKKMRDELRDWDLEQAAIEQKQIDGMYEKAEAIKRTLDPTIELAEAQNDLNELVEKGLITQNEADEYIKRTSVSISSAKGYMKDLGATFHSAFEDAIVGGKKFSDVLAGVAQDIERMLTRRAITDPLMKGFDSMVLGPLSEMFGGIFSANANGGVYSGAGISAYSGSIVSSPTIFPFAKGTGLMGEAGPEAILPLSRGSDGKLGVSGGGNNVTVNVFEATGTKASVQQEQGSDGSMNIKVIVEQLYGVMNRDISRGTGIAPTLERRYGLNRVSGGF